MGMKHALGCLAVLGSIALANPALAQSGDGNGGLSGPHYNLNILGKATCAGDDLTGSNRHTIQVLLNYHDATPTDPTSDPALDRRNKIFLAEGDFQVLDGNACDGDGATFQLPANPYTCPADDPYCLNSDPTFQSYTVWARARSGGGSATMTTCRLDKATAEYQCSTENTLDVLVRTKGKNTNNFTNVTKELTTVCLDTDADTACDFREGIFANDLFSYYWDYDNFGLRLAQLRFYPIPD
jgi:hypothetical protein